MITAKIIADSISPVGKRITTFEIEYPRFIHSEFMTHRMLSKNAASSRAIPVTATIKQILDDPAMPVHWGKNQAGMAAKEEINNDSHSLRFWQEVDYDDSPREYGNYAGDLSHVKTLWLAARNSAIVYAKKMIDAGLHKQVANRILEPWVHIKVVVTATEWDNFFHLRNHPDAQPEIHELAKVMWGVYSTNATHVVGYDDYHLPYITEGDRATYSLEDCIKLSASLCAQVSYRKADESLDKALMIYDRLVTSIPVHASPFEHQATPSIIPDKASANFRGWYQYRQRLPHNVCHKYTPHES